MRSKVKVEAETKVCKKASWEHRYSQEDKEDKRLSRSKDRVLNGLTGKKEEEARGT
jgi:hypothetical protein